MLGMLVTGVKIAFAGRWRGMARWYPLTAESWVFVTLPAMASSVAPRVEGDRSSCPPVLMLDEPFNGRNTHPAFRKAAPCDAACVARSGRCAASRRSPA